MHRLIPPWGFTFLAKILWLGPSENNLYRREVQLVNSSSLSPHPLALNHTRIQLKLPTRSHLLIPPIPALPFNCFKGIPFMYLPFAKSMFHCPVVLKGIHHYWEHVLIFSGDLSNWKVARLYPCRNPRPLPNPHQPRLKTATDWLRIFLNLGTLFLLRFPRQGPIS